MYPQGLSFFSISYWDKLGAGSEKQIHFLIFSNFFATSPVYHPHQVGLNNQRIPKVGTASAEITTINRHIFRMKQHTYGM